MGYDPNNEIHYDDPPEEGVPLFTCDTWTFYYKDVPALKDNYNLGIFFCSGEKIVVAIALILIGLTLWQMFVQV